MEELKTNAEDISSYSNFDEIKQKEMNLNISLDFAKRQMIGTVEAKYEILNEKITRIILDLKGPEITSVDYISRDADDEILKQIPLSYEIDTNNKYKDALGTPLVISLNNLIKESKEDYEKSLKDKTISIRIGFITTEKCTGIQFLTKEQTYTKKYPFMFTQCEAIQCRSLFPVQDSPSVKAIYKVQTSVKSPLTFLFGGILKTKYYDSCAQANFMEFEQNIPIPAYLVSFVGGELEYGRISSRCGIWTEVGLCKKACHEFKDAEKYIEIAENYFKHPYEWKIYNLLVLPFSFPYGGMENPNLTFVTPALLAGDCSMSNVIGHEISHSWTGNLVTNKNWKNFWVNEGFTTFMERKLDSALLGTDMENLEAIVGNNELIDDIKMAGEDSEYTCLSPNYEGIDPDDGFNTVPYEKGYQFLVFLEKQVGKENFQEILHRYIEKFKYQSVDYTAFKNVYEEFVNEKFKKKIGKKILSNIDWDKWLNEKGIPTYQNEFVSKYLDEAQKMAEDFINGNEDAKTAIEIFKNWHTNVKLVFLNYLLENEDKISDDVMKRLKNELNLAEIYNSEIKYMWYRLALDKNLEDEIPNVKKFLQTIGRLKYIRPIYLAWIDSNFTEAKKFFDENKFLYHPFARRIIQDRFNSKDEE